MIPSIQGHVQRNCTGRVPGHETGDLLCADERGLHATDGADTAGDVVRVELERSVDNRHIPTSLRSGDRVHAFDFRWGQETERLQIRRRLERIYRELHLGVADIVRWNLTEHQPRRHNVRNIFSRGVVGKFAIRAHVLAQIRVEMLTLHGDDSPAVRRTGLGCDGKNVGHRHVLELQPGQREVVPVHGNLHRGDSSLQRRRRANNLCRRSGERRDWCGTEPTHRPASGREVHPFHSDSSASRDGAANGIHGGDVGRRHVRKLHIVHVPVSSVGLQSHRHDILRMCGYVTRRSRARQPA